MTPQLFGSAEWQPIETAPKDGSEFLFWMPHEEWERKAYGTLGYCTIGAWRTYRFNPSLDCFETDEGQNLSGATHWSKLPEPPKQ